MFFDVTCEWIVIHPKMVGLSKKGGSPLSALRASSRRDVVHANPRDLKETKKRNGPAIVFIPLTPVSHGFSGPKTGLDIYKTPQEREANELERSGTALSREEKIGRGGKEGVEGKGGGGRTSA